MDRPSRILEPGPRLTREEVKKFAKEYVNIMGYTDAYGNKVAPKEKLNESRREVQTTRRRLVATNQRADEALQRYEEATDKKDRARMAIKAAGMDRVRSLRQGHVIRAEAEERREHRAYKAYKGREKEAARRVENVTSLASEPGEEKELVDYRNLHVAREAIRRATEYEGIMGRIDPPTLFSQEQLRDTRQQIEQARMLASDVEGHQRRSNEARRRVEASLQAKGVMPLPDT